MARSGFFFCCLLLLTLCADISTARPSWCVARKNADISKLESFINFTCGWDPRGCRIIKPGPIGFCYDKTSNRTIQIRSQASYLLNRYYVNMNICNILGEIVVNYPTKDTIGNISMGDLCFPSRNTAMNADSGI